MQSIPATLQPWHLRQRALSLINIGRPREALLVLGQALSIVPDNADLLCATSLAHLNLNEYQAALDYANRAIAASPEQEWGHRLRSKALMSFPGGGGGRSACLDEALSSAREAVRLAPREMLALSVLVQAQLARDLPNQARQTAELLLEVAPDAALAHEAMGQVCIKQRKWKELETHCRNALRINPESYVAMNNLGLALLKSHRRVQAIGCFFRAASLNPANTTARTNLNSSVRALLAIPIVMLLPGVCWGILTPLTNVWIGTLAAIGMAALLLSIQTFRLPREMREHLLTTKARGKLYLLPIAVLGAAFGTPNEPGSARTSLRRLGLIVVIISLIIAGAIWGLGRDAVTSPGPILLIAMMVFRAFQRKKK
jgi:tetratricopeptide (TPR) repeat protein